jgi:hypothetical protein
MERLKSKISTMTMVDIDCGEGEAIRGFMYNIKSRIIITIKRGIHVKYMIMI